MLKRRFLLTIICIFIFTIVVNGQRRYQDTDRQIERFSLAKSIFFNYDVSTFATEYPDSFQTYISVSFINDLLQFVKISNSLYTAQFEVSLSILNEENELLQSQIFKKEISANDFKTTNSRSIVHSYYHTFLLKAGKYKLLIELSDMDTRKTLKREEEFELKKLGEKTISLLEPIIFSRLIPGSMTFEAFDKSQTDFLAGFLNDSTIIVSPFKINEIEQYRITSPFVLYHEIYKQKSQDSLRIEYRLIDKNNNIVWTKVTKSTEPDRNKISRTIEIDPGDYKPGYYNLQIVANYQTEKQSVQVRIHFNPGRTFSLMEDSSGSTSPIDEFGPLQYIIDKKEYDYLSSLSPQEQKAAVEEFWNERSPSGNLRNEFIRRIRFSNQNFVSLVKNNPGWQTDQGRTYIIYGPADEILHPQSPNSQFQHEIWVYNKLTPNRRFLFVFKPDVGEYILMRSE